MKRIPRERLFWTAGLFGIYTAIAVLMFGYHYLNDVANGTTDTWPRRLIEETTGVYSALVLLPFIIWVARRFRPSLKWGVTAIAWILGALAYTAAHTTLMAASRAAIYHLLGWGSYDYGIMIFRYPMEASNDVVTFVTVATIVTFWDRMQAARRAELEAADLKTKLAEAQLQNLRLQLHPHFLFNTLNAVSTVMYEDVHKADEMLARLSDFLRLVLESSDVQQVPLDEEIAIERMYVEIMTARLERRLNLSVRVDDDARSARVPFMLLQPLLENSIRHGMRSESENLELRIDISRQNGTTVIRVCDDGSGISQNPKRGIGLTNVESRLRYLYGSDASLDLRPREPAGTQATLTFPYSAGDAR